ncbi:hypothetical protein Mgra_00006506 [Meloidogyne graminicola]|uniref:RRM domain-containing protein n=1 Tax=Meloidogyne graminicola TaxID=189291 RepID=A0A8S9ZKV1_9BILA|nr:hypothetical protein Mgra_00006506 [Meloidogyne graminicola]
MNSTLRKMSPKNYNIFHKQQKKVMSSSFLQDLLKGHNSQPGDWSDMVNSHQEEAAAIESLRARQATYDINQDGPFYIFVSQLNSDYFDKRLQTEIYNFFEGPKNLFYVHNFKSRGCCMLRAKNFESCIQILRKDGEKYKDKPISVEYVVPPINQSADQPINYARFTQIQLDAQVEMFQQKQKSKPPKPNPFGDAKPADISKKMEEVALKVQAEKVDKKPVTKPVETNTFRGRTFTNRDKQPSLKNDNYRDNRPPRSGGDHYQHHPKYQGQHKYHPRILSHKSNDGENNTINSKGSNSYEVSNKFGENKGNIVGEISKIKNVDGNESETISTSTTGKTTTVITNITTAGSTIATTSNNGSTVTTLTTKSNSNTISTAIQQSVKIIKQKEGEDKVEGVEHKVEEVEQHKVKEVEQQKILLSENISIEANKNIVDTKTTTITTTTTTTLEKKPKQKAKKNKKQNKNVTRRLHPKSFHAIERSFRI